MGESFDELAKSVASGRLTRRQALRRLGAGAGVGLMALMTGGRGAFAARRVCPPGTSQPCGAGCCPRDAATCCGGTGTCCPQDTNCCASVEGATTCCPTGAVNVNLCGTLPLQELLRLGCVLSVQPV